MHFTVIAFRRDDLVVGAPFYHSRTASGAVYIYMNNDGGFTPNHPYTKIEGLFHGMIILSSVFLFYCWNIRK